MNPDNFTLEFVPVAANVDPCKHCFFSKSADAPIHGDGDRCAMNDLEQEATKDIHCHSFDGGRTDGQKGYWRLKLQ